MNQVHRQLLFDAILAVSALAMTVIFGASKCSQQHDPTAGELLLPRAATETCQRLMLRRGLAEIRLSKQEGTGSWVTEQQQFPLGGSAAVERLLAALREIRVIRHLGGNSNRGELKRLGLDPPVFTWKVSGNEQPWVVKFGSSVPGGGNYVSVGRDASGAVEQIYAVDTDLATLDITPEELIDPVLLRVRELDIADMTYESAQQSFHIRRDQHGMRWRESEPPGCRVDPEQASALLDELERLTPTPAGGSAPPGSDDGVLSGVLKLRAPSHEATMQFMGSCDQVPGLTRTRVTRVGTAEYCVDAGALAQLLKRGLARDTRLFTLRVDEVESLRTSHGGDVEELRREGVGFVFEQQGPNFIDVEVGNGYLADLLGARGRFASGDLAPSEPSDSIRLRSSVIGTGDYEEKLLVGPAMPDGSRFVRRVDDSAVLRIDEGTADLLQVGRHVLKQATRAPLDAGQSD